MRKCASWWALLALVACVPENDPVVVTDPPDLQPRATWQASLAAVATAAVTGTATIADFGPFFDIQMAVTGAAPSASYQWRIFNGTCQEPGAQHGPNQAYPNITTSAAGSAQVTRTISGTLNLNGAYNVRVSTVAAPVTIVACGNLTKGA